MAAKQVKRKMDVVKFMPEVDVDMIVHHNERPAKSTVTTAKKETEEGEYPDCVWP